MKILKLGLVLVLAIGLLTMAAAEQDTHTSNGAEKGKGHEKAKGQGHTKDREDRSNKQPVDHDRRVGKDDHPGLHKGQNKGDEPVTVKDDDGRVVDTSVDVQQARDVASNGGVIVLSGRSPSGSNMDRKLWKISAEWERDGEYCFSAYRVRHEYVPQGFGFLLYVSEDQGNAMTQCVSAGTYDANAEHAYEKYKVFDVVY